MNMKTKRLVTDALCAALYVVLATFASLRLGPMTISLQSLAVLLGAVLFGPVDGLIVGLLGEFLSQLLTYGLSATTVLWILPPGLMGLTVGLLMGRKEDAPPLWRYGLFLLLGLAVDTTVTTGAMYVDCLVYHYSFVTYAPYIVWRYLADVIKAGIYILILPPLVRAIRKVKS